jgi:hypothetical protein
MQDTRGIPKRQLNDVLSWAERRLAGGTEPSWARYQHMKLVEAIRSILRSEADHAALAHERMDQTPPKTPDWPVQVLS